MHTKKKETLLDGPYCNHPTVEKNRKKKRTQWTYWAFIIFKVIRVH